MNTLSKHDGRMLICSDIDQMNRFYVFAFFSVSSHSSKNVCSYEDGESIVFFFFSLLFFDSFNT